VWGPQSPTSALFASLNPSPRGLNGSAAGLFHHLSPASMERGLMGPSSHRAGTSSADGLCLTPITRELARASGGGGGQQRREKKRDLQIMIPATASVKGDVRRCSPGKVLPRPVFRIQGGQGRGGLGYKFSLLEP
jgi:hypothetical protein